MEKVYVIMGFSLYLKPPEKRTHGSGWDGTTSLFAALSAADRAVIASTIRL